MVSFWQNCIQVLVSVPKLHFKSIFDYFPYLYFVGGVAYLKAQENTKAEMLREEVTFYVKGEINTRIQHCAFDM